MSKENISRYLNETKDFSAQQILQYAAQLFNGRLSLATSLGEEDQILTDMISRVAPGISVFTLDTGRLFPETYELIAKTQKRYNINFDIYYPNTQSVEHMVKAKGVNLFYDSVENRKECCQVRKVEPLRRALAGVDAWITGLRKAQSITRAGARAFEWDDANQKVKINPLVNWSLDQVHTYIKENQLDINPLHQQGFVSIGCAPCTRAIKPGEDIRSGRWWWETPEQKECGLHNNPNRLKKQGG